MKAIENAIEPMKVARMTPDEREKYKLLKQTQAIYKAEQEKKKQILEE